MATRKQTHLIFHERFVAAILSGEPVEVTYGENTTTFRLDMTHGECVCRIDKGEETPLFSSKYLHGEFRA